MKKIYWLASLFLTFVLLGQNIPIHAQDTTESLLYIQNGSDVFGWNGTELTRIDNLGCNGLFGIYAPNNTGQYVQTIIEQSWAEAEREPFGGGVENPINIMLCHLTSNAEPQIIAAQPDGYAIKDDGHAENFVVRGQPAWSPDGTQLVWTELRSTGSNLTVVVYDVVSATLTDVVEDVPPAVFTVGGPVLVYWSNYGIVLDTFTLNDVGNPLPTFILVDPDSGEQILYLFTPPAPVANGFSTSAQAVSISNRFFTDEGVIFLFTDGSWQVLYWADGSQSEFTGHVALVSTLNPIGLEVQLSVDTELNYQWTVLNPAGAAERLPITSKRFEPFAISPDGTQLAYILDGFAIWQDGTTIELDLDLTIVASIGLWWSPTILRISE